MIPCFTREVFVKKITALGFLTLLFVIGYGQTTYIWNIAGGGAYTTATNWSPNGVPVSGDNVIFNLATAGTITAVPNGTVLNNLTVNGAGDVTLNSTSAANILAFSGTVQANLGGVIKGGAITFQFNAGSTYEHNRNGGIIPTATWDAASNCNIKGLVATTLTGFAAQSFGNVTFDCPGMNAALSIGNTGATIKGNLNVVNTGSGSVVLNTISNTLTVNGDININGGTLNLNSGTATATLNLDGNYTQNGGVFLKSGSTSAATVTFRGVGRTYTRSGGTADNVMVNYVVNGTGATLTLNSNIAIPAGRSFTVTTGTLYCGTNIISGAGSFVISSANAALGIGSPVGITAAVATLTGNIQTTGARTFGTSGSYIYTGTNGQITGSGLPAAVAGYVMVSMQNTTDQLTFTTTALSGAVTLRMVNGSVANALSFSNIGSTLSYEAAYPQITTSNEFPGGTTTPGKLTIDNPNGVTMHASRWMRGTNDALKLVNGILYIPVNDTITTSNTVATITGGSATSYVSGAISRSTSTATNLNFPIGKGSYNPVTISPTTSGTIFITAEVFDADAGGSGSLGIASLNTNRYWKITKTGAGTLTSINTPSITEYTLTAANHLCYSATTGGIYTMIPSTVGADVVTPNSAIPIPTGATNGEVNLVIGTGGTLSGTIQVGNSSSIQKLYQIAQLLNTSTVTGDVIFELQADYDGTTGEIFPINFYQYNTSGGSWKATVRPAANATGLRTSANPGSGINFIAFNGVDNLTFDGRPGGAGNSIEWIIRNAQPTGTASFTSTIQLVNDATYNKLQYLQLEGQNTNAASNGTVMIGTTTGTTGNDYNAIQFCSIRDRSDVAGTPANGIYAVGTFNKENDHNIIRDNNIFNFWANGGEAHGIYINSYNADWEVKGNHLYQTATRTATATGKSYGIRVSIASSTVGYNFVIDSNYIGGSAPYTSGSMWTQNGNVNSSFIAINMDGHTGSMNTIKSNKVSNIYWRSNNNTTTPAPGVFTGIYVLNGGADIENNTIGAAAGNDSIILVSAASVTTVTPVSYGIVNAGSSGTINMLNNTVGAIKVEGFAATNSYGFVAIQVAQAGSSSTRTVSNNLVGSLVTPNSIHVATSYTGSAPQLLMGINFATGSNPIVVTGNTVSNLSNKYAGTATGAQTVGIQVGSGSGNFADNTVSNITSASASAGTGITAGVIGIYYGPTASGNSFTSNIVHSLSNTSPSAAVNVSGIVYSGPSTNPSSNYVDKNLVHSLTLASSNGSATITGINHLVGYAFFRNNMVRLGINASGASVSNGCSIIGFNKASVTTSYIYHNSIYVGGTGVTGSAKTYAFKRTNTLFTTSTRDAVKNNIFVNNRSNGSGTGAHFAIGITQFTGLATDSCNYNLLEASGTGGNAGENNITALATLAAWRSGSSPSQDNASYFGAPGFINPTGNASLVDLHIDTAIPTQVESNATPLGNVSDDYDGDARTSPDIGADEGMFTPIDLTTPAITYIPFAGACNDVTTHNVSVSITDASGVNTAPGLVPRIYYKEIAHTNTFVDNTSATNGWKYVEASNTSSPFNFTIDFSLLYGGGITANDSIQYFVVAQDMATPNPNNVGISSGSAVFASLQSSVALTSGAFPIGGTPNLFMILPCSGTITVGIGGNYGVFTTANGIFNAINNATLSGNLTINVVSDINTEDGSVPLYQWAENTSGPYSITIQSSSNTLRSITNTTGGTSGLFRMDGADRVTFNGGTGTNKYLSFRNIANNSTFSFVNDATNITINNCILEGMSNSTTNGVVFFGTTTGTTGNDNITITACDIKDGSTTPVNGIYAAGNTAAGKENSGITISNCNIYNFFSATNASSGILVATGNNTWSIINNRFYQTATRTTTTASLIHSVIRVNNTSGGGFNINDNYIGGSNAAGTGTMAYASATSPQMGVIYVGVATSPVSTVNNNTIKGVSFSSNSATTANQGAFSAIYASNGTVNVTNNIIGSTTDTSSISVLIITNGGGLVAGIKNTSTASSTISGNTIGGITGRGTGTNNPVNVYGIHFTAGTLNINSNVIGSAVIPNSLQSFGTAAAATSTVTGILGTASSLYTPSVNDNQIRGLYNYNTGTATTVCGINVSSGAAYTVNGNTVYNLTGTGTPTGSGTSSAVSGILYATGVTVPVSISQNTIYNLWNNNSASSVVTGIFYNGGTNANSSVSKNKIDNLIAGTGTASVINGLHIPSASGSVTVSNNMIRLGYNNSGIPITTPSAINGILKENTGASTIYHNSVYIGGAGVASSANSTYAFRRVSTTVSAENIRNNIFVNERSNAAGTAKHYSYWLGALGTAISNYNLFYAPSGVLFSLNGADQTTLSGWKGITGNPDLNSAVADPNFAGATSAVADLHLASPSPAEGGGIDIPTITDDIDGDVRAANTPVDIGADATIVVQQDIYPPTITYTPIPVQSNCGNLVTNVQVTVNDPGMGVSLIANKPRMYLRKSVGTPTVPWGAYSSVEGVLVSGNTNSSVWNFAVDFAALGIAVSNADQFEYYFVAQDQATIPNVGYSQQNVISPVHSDVATVTTYPNFTLSTAGVFTIANPLSGTVTVGISGTYATFNGPSGLFNAINTRGLNGNLIVDVISDVNESGLYQPLGVIPEYCGTGYTILIKPDAATIRTVSQSNGGNPMIVLMGCKRVTFDGSFNGAGNYLLFRQQQNTPTFYFNGVSATATEDIIIRNSTIEGSNQSTSGVGPGVVSFAGLLGTGSAIRNIVIDSDTIRNRKDANTVASSPQYLIYAGGSNATNLPLKSNITISNNAMFNFSNSAISFIQNNSFAGIGDSIVITDNAIYEPLTYATYQYAVWLESGSGKGHIIANNKIGGNSFPNPDITGTWLNNKLDGEIVPIYTLNGGTTPSDGTQVTGNTISGFNLSNTGYTNFIGIRNEGGAVNIANNIIGSTTVPNSIRNNGSGGIYYDENTATIGIWNQAAEESSIQNNTIANLLASNSFSYMLGIEHGSNKYHNGVAYLTQAGGRVNISGNSIYNLNCAGTIQNDDLPDVMLGIFCYTGNTNGNVITGNTVYNLNATNGTSNNRKVTGVSVGIMGLATSQGGIVEKNSIYNLNLNSSGTLAELNGLIVAEGSWRVANNSISLSNSAYSTKSPFVSGIQDWTISGTSNSFYHNSVYIGGTLSSGSNSSYAYYRAPLNLDIDYGVMHGSNVTIGNNIFFNDRTGGSTNNIAIGNLNLGNSTDLAVGWSSDYNFIIAQNVNQVGRWGVTTAGDRNFANWQTSSSGDANSVTALITTGTSNATQTNPAELFLSHANGNLRINVAPPNAPYPYSCVRNAGTAITIVTADIDNDPRDPSSPDLGCDEFTDCTTPAIAITVNGLSGTSAICSGSNVTLNVTSTGSGNNCSGNYEYAIRSGVLYWNGSAFASSSPVYSSAYSGISFAPSAASSYTAIIACSADQTCRSNSNTLTVNTLDSIANVIATIGVPANGLNHYMSVTWAAVTGATGYDVDYSNNGTVWNNVASNINSTTFNHNTGDNPNIATYYRVRPRTSGTVCGYTAMTTPVFTACDAPELPLVDGATSSSVNVTLQAEAPVANPAYTTYSIFCTTTYQYVQADGTLSATEVFQTAAQWGTITVTGLSLNTSYCFYAKARNMDGDIRTGGANLLPVERFNSNIIDNSLASPTNKWWTPNINPPLAYSLTGGCTGGMIGYSSAYNNYWGSFIRMPEQDCNGMNSVIMSFDISNSFFATNSTDHIRLYLWDNYFTSGDHYYNASAVRINGLDVTYSDINGTKLLFNQNRNCTRVDVEFDFNQLANEGFPMSHRDKLLFFIEPNCEYHNSNAYSVAIDNISISQTVPTACATTVSCIAPSITVQPAVPDTLCANNGTATISVAATGTALAYQWRKGGSDIIIGGVYSVSSDATGSTLTITNPGVTDAGSYDVVVTGGCSPAVTSSSILLSVDAPISGLSASANSPICEGNELNLSTLLVTGTGVNWTWSGPGFSSALQNPTLADIVETDNEGNYIVTAQNVCNAVSDSVVIAVHRNVLGLVANTSTGQICTSDTLFLTASYVNIPLPVEDVQWTWIGPNGVIANTETAFIYPLSNVDEGTYDLSASNACGVQIAGTGTVVVDEFIEADAGPDGVTNVCGVLTAQLQGNSYVGSGVWTEISAGTSNFSPGNTDSNALVTSDNYGLKQYRWTITNGVCVSEDDVRFYFNPQITATVDLAGCNFTNADSIFVNVSATGGSSTLVINPPVGSELKLDVDASTKVYISPMDGIQRTYTVSDGICSVNASVTSPLGPPTDIPFTSTNGTVTADCYDNSFTRWLTFRDTNNDAILSVNDNGQNLGKITASVYRDSNEPAISQVSTGACQGVEQLAMKRHFVLQSDAPQPFASDVSLRLYFSEAELNDLIVASQGNDVAGNECTEYDNLTGLNDLFVTKYSGVNEDGDYMNNDASGIYRVYAANDGTLQPQANGFPTIFHNGQNHHYVELNVREFSELWLHGSGTGSALPVEMIYLNAEGVNNEFIKLTWATALEINNNGFVVERSINAHTWESIGWVDGHNNATTQHDYLYNDHSVLHNVRYYYRLKQVDNDGEYEYTGMVSAIVNAAETAFTLNDFIPNPAMNSTTLVVLSPTAQDIEIDVYNAIGQKVHSNVIGLVKGANNAKLDVSDWAAGTYTAVVLFNSEVYSKKLVITK